MEYDCTNSKALNFTFLLSIAMTNTTALNLSFQIAFTYRISRENIFFKFIFREMETAQVRERHREMERERIPSGLRTASAKPDVGLGSTEPQDHELR